MNEQSFDSSKPEFNDSDNEFYDAYETMEHKMGNLMTKDKKDDAKNAETSNIEAYSDSDDNEDFMTMKSEFGKDFESKDFMNRHENLTKLKDDEEILIDETESKKDNKETFVPLHEQLNAENKDNEEHNDDENSNNDIDKGPYYVDEISIEKEFADLTELELEEKMKVAMEYKSEGNKLFSEEKYAESLEKYTLALRSCPLKYEKERAIFYSNRSICYFKMKDDVSCVKECTRAIEINPQFVKPLLRRAECNQNLDKLDEALNDYKRLCELQPSNMNYKRKVMELEETIRERNEKLKEEMMGKLKDLGNMCLKPFGLSTNNFQFVQDPATGSYSVNFKQN